MSKVLNGAKFLCKYLFTCIFFIIFLIITVVLLKFAMVETDAIKSNAYLLENYAYDPDMNYYYDYNYLTCF